MFITRKDLLIEEARDLGDAEVHALLIPMAPENWDEGWKCLLDLDDWSCSVYCVDEWDYPQFLECRILPEELPGIQHMIRYIFSDLIPVHETSNIWHVTAS